MFFLYPVTCQRRKGAWPPGPKDYRLLCFNCDLLSSVAEILCVYLQVTLLSYEVTFQSFGSFVHIVCISGDSNFLWLLGLITDGLLLFADALLLFTDALLLFTDALYCLLMHCYCTAWLAISLQPELDKTLSTKSNCHHIHWWLIRCLASSLELILVELKSFKLVLQNLNLAKPFLIS